MEVFQPFKASILSPFTDYKCWKTNEYSITGHLWYYITQQTQSHRTHNGTSLLVVINCMSGCQLFAGSYHRDMTLEFDINLNVGELQRSCNELFVLLSCPVGLGRNNQREAEATSLDWISNMSFRELWRGTGTTFSKLAQKKKRKREKKMNTESAAAKPRVQTQTNEPCESCSLWGVEVCYPHPVLSHCAALKVLACGGVTGSEPR